MNKVETVVNFAAGHWGEDRLCLLEDMYCVVDGATPLKQTPFAGYHSSAEWMADGLVAYLKENADCTQSYSSLCKAFVDSAGDVRNTFENVYDLPCLTTAALQKQNQQLKCWALGDCSIYLWMKDGQLCHITDKRVSRFSEKTVQVKAAALSRGEDPTDAVLAQRIRNKAMMNQPGGYWTVGFVGNFAGEFVEHSFDLDQVQAALLCSDGLDRLFHHYGVDPQELLSGKQSLQAAVALLREKENAGNDMDVKQHDDVAAILVKF